MKHSLRFTVLMLLVSGFGASSKETRAVAADSWKSPPITIPQARCHPSCPSSYNGDPVPIKVIAPDGLDARTARLECNGNGCQFDHGDVVLHKGTFIGTWYSRSEAVTIYVVAEWKN